MAVDACYTSSKQPGSRIKPGCECNKMSSKTACTCHH